MRTLAMIMVIVCAIVLLFGGCATYVPVSLSGPKVPTECKRRHPRDLPSPPSLAGPMVSPDQLNRHWAKHHRLKSRPRYRRLRRNYQICSKYARR